MVDIVHDGSGIRTMALLSNWQPNRIDWLRVFLQRFAIVPSSRDLVLKWAEVMVAARRVGRRLETADAWIAATAVLYGAPLITHNGGDYSRSARAGSNYAPVMLCAPRTAF